MFKNLSINELLSTCLHGKAQNNNKYLNSITSKRCPKYIFVGCTTLGTGVSSGVINFNNGTHGLYGVFCTNFCISQESNRIVETDHDLRGPATFSAIFFENTFRVKLYINYVKYVNS